MHSSIAWAVLFGWLVLVCFHYLQSFSNRIMPYMQDGPDFLASTSQDRRQLYVYLDSFKWVSCTPMLSMTGGREDSSEVTNLNSFWTLIKPRSATKALQEVEDSGTTITGAFKLISIKRRKLFLAKSFMLEAAISAAWTVTAFRASRAVWKLFKKFCWKVVKRVRVLGERNKLKKKYVWDKI